MTRFSLVLSLFPIVLGVSTMSCGPAPGMVDDGHMFEPGRIVEVGIEVAEEDWDLFRGQSRQFEDVFCNDQPPPRPFDYVRADVVIDGIRVRDVGVRKKCFFGSCDEIRPALKISFNHYLRGRRFYGMRRMTLNNNLSDPSAIKQCLGYWIFRRAGVIAPRCNFAHVRINGVDKGIYTHVESIKTELLARYFPDTSGNLYEGALSDFQPDWVGTFQKKTNEESPYRGDLDQVVWACQVPDEELAGALEAVIDLDDFYTFWAAEVALAHWDGYASRNHNNFYVYNNPDSGRFHFIPWGIDGILFSNPDEATPKSVFADAIIPHRLYKLPATRQVYLDRLREVLDAVWAEEEILAEIDRMEALITPYADPYGSGELAGHIEAVRAFVRYNPDAIRDEIEAGPIQWEAELPGPPCFRQLGTIAGTFETVWGSVARENPWEMGTGTLAIVLFDDEGNPTEPLPTSLVSAAAGWDPEAQPGSPPSPVLQMVAIVPGEPNETWVLAVVMISEPALVAPGATVELNFGASFGVLVHIDPAQPGSEQYYLMMNGAVQFEQAGRTEGAMVTGSLQADITESGW